MMKKIISLILASVLLLAVQPSVLAGEKKVIEIKPDGTSVIQAEDYTDSYLVQIQNEAEGITNLGYLDAIDEQGNHAWMTYTLNVAEAGMYDLLISSGLISSYCEDVGDFYINDKLCDIKYNINSTNSWFVFRDYELGRIELPAGKVIFKVQSKGSMGNIDLFTLTRNDTPAADTTPANPVAAGDTDKNGKIDSSDALQVLQYCVNLRELTDEQLINSDVSCENGVSSLDALMILQNTVGKIDFPKNYTLVYADADDTAKTAAEAIAKKAADYGVTVPVVSDAQSAENSDKYEIYIGNTSRQATSECYDRLGINKCSVTAEGKKIIICAKENKYLTQLCDVFTINYLDIGGFELPEKYNRTYSGDFVNPVCDGGDPDIVIYEGKYYMYVSGDVERFHVKVSDDMIHWTDMGVCLSEQAVGDRDFWAPEVKYHNGEFVMCYSAKEGEDYNQHLAIATSDSPLGPFIQKSRGFLSTSGPSELDDSVFFDDDGTAYIYFARWMPGEQAEVIFGAVLNDDYSGYTDTKRIFGPELDWELASGRIAEAPHMIKHNGTYYLAYTANTVTSSNYSVGCAISDNPLEGFTKYSSPILTKSADVMAPGHNSFAESLDGSELFMVSHAWEYLDNVGWRTIRFERCAFKKNPDGGPDILTVYGPTFNGQLCPANN